MVVCEEEKAINKNAWAVSSWIALSSDVSKEATDCDANVAEMGSAGIQNTTAGEKGRQRNLADRESRFEIWRPRYLGDVTCARHIRQWPAKGLQYGGRVI